MAASYASALRLLSQRQETRWELGLARIRRLLGRLGNPQDAVPSVHVAGTNGKGSVCAWLAAVFNEAGCPAGLYTSPHLAEPVERIQLGGAPVSREDFADLLERVRLAERGEESTYFELLTAASFLHFKERGAKINIVETGLGGRLDATNAIARPELTVITSIGLDHVQHLGSTVEAIAAEKAGILKAGAPCLIGKLPPGAASVVRRAAASLGAALIEAAPLRQIETHWESGSQAAADSAGRRFELGLLGRAAAANAGVLLAAVGILRERGWKIPDAALERGLASARWPCRFEPLRWRGRTVVLDGAHNPDAARAFIDTWTASPWAGSGFMIAGALADKDWRSLAKILAPAARRGAAVRPDSPRALEPGLLAEALRAEGAGVEVEPSFERALTSFERSGAPAAAVCGSFYLAGKARAALTGVAA